MKRLKIIIVAALVLVFVLFLYRDTITIKFMERLLDRNFSSDLTTDLSDGLHVFLCGAGSPMFDLKRSGPCTAILAGNRVFVVDTGNAASKNLTIGRVPMRNIEAVFLTHFHSDHIDGLGELIMQRWANGAKEAPLAVFGPIGVEQVVAGFNQAYQYDDAYRIAHHGEVIMPPMGSNALAHQFLFDTSSDSSVVYEKNGLKVTAFIVNHKPVSPAVGYRFDYKGRSVVISGDTVKSDTVAKFSKHVDVLLHDALSPELVMIINERAKQADRGNIAAITADIIDYHATPVEAAETAEAAMVGHLVFHHIVPPLPVPTLERIFLRGIDEVYSGKYTLGKDGTFISLPADSKDIEVKELIW